MPGHRQISLARETERIDFQSSDALSLDFHAYNPAQKDRAAQVRPANNNKESCRAPIQP
jgi:hypothetical protein